MATMEDSSVGSTTAINPISQHKASHTHKLKRKPTDPFLKLSNNIQPQAPSNPEEDEAQTTVLTKFIIAPLITVSFIFSLTLVDFRNRSYRADQHPNSNRRGLWARLQRWLNLEPYEETEWIPLTDSSHDQTLEGHSDASGQSVKEYKGTKWVLRKKHRAVAGMELTDAWELRRSVMVSLAAFAIVSLFLVIYCALMAWNWIKT